MPLDVGRIPLIARGSCENRTYLRNQHREYARARIAPDLYTSEYAIFAREAYTSARNAWRDTLTNADRARWREYAREHPTPNHLGDDIVMPANALHLQFNMPRFYTGAALLRTPPPQTLPPPLSPALDPQTQILAGRIIQLSNLFVGADDNDTPLYVRATSPLPPGIKPQNNMFTVLNNPILTPPQPSTDLASLYDARIPYTRAAEHNTITVRARRVTDSTGTLGPWQQHTITLPEDPMAAYKLVPLTGTTPSSQGGYVTIAHGQNVAKIAAVQTLIVGSNNNLWQPNTPTADGHQYTNVCGATNMVIELSAANSYGILTKPIRIILTVEI